MSKYIVSARKYRPQKFEEVVGQEHVAKTLTNAINNDQLAQAFLFCGPRGVGKTSCARILAKILNCRDIKEKSIPCEKCEACLSFSDNTSFNIIELDAASHNSVDHIRTLNEQVRFRPQQGEYKIFIIDEVHMLSTSAFNAFLKTLEEPPPYAIFILATTEKHKIIPTILSRCQIFNFKRISVPDIVERLKLVSKSEKVSIDDESLHLIAQKSDGALRDALSIFDKIASAAQGKVSYQDTIENLNVLDHEFYFKIVDASLKEDISSVLNIYGEILKSGFEPELFVTGLSDHYRNIMLAKNQTTLNLMDCSDSIKERYKNQSELLELDYILNALNILNEVDLTLPRSNQKNLHVEIGLSKIVYQKHIKKKRIVRTSNPPSQLKRQNSSRVEQKIEVQKTPEEKEVIELAKPRLVAPKINTNLNSIISQIRAEEKQKAENTVSFDHNNVDAIWKDYASQHPSNAVKTDLSNTQFEIKGKSLGVFVPTSVAKSTIQQEKDLLNLLRTKFNIVDLSIDIQVDLEKFPDHETIESKKLLSDREIYDLMVEENPAIKDLVKRFEMKPVK